MLRIILTASVLLFVLSAFTSATDTSAKKGKELFRDYCAMCHRVDGKGMCMAPSLVGITQRMTTEEIAAHSRKIADQMMCARSINELTDKDFTDIVAYLKTLEDR